MKNRQTVERRERKAPWGPRPFRESSVEGQTKARSCVPCPRPSPLVARPACRAEAERRRAFTLIELLVVIAIIGILAAILLPTLAAAKVQAQKKEARLQINDLVQQIQNYDSQYSRMPISPGAQALALQSPNDGMFTYGGSAFQTPTGPWTPATITAFYPTNTQVIAILMDITNTDVTAVNANNQKNPQQTVFLSAKQVDSTNLPGVGPDLVYRDPWRHPYVITMDLNEDNQCKDPFYSLQKVSQTVSGSQNGYNGLFNPDSANPDSDNFRYHGNVMVWSAGPDGKIDPDKSANEGVNKDNIVSWQ